MSTENDLDKLRYNAEVFISEYLYPFIYEQYLEANIGKTIEDEEILDRNDIDLLDKLRHLKGEFDKKGSPVSWSYIWVRTAIRLNAISCLVQSDVNDLNELDQKQTQTRSIFDLAGRVYNLKQRFNANHFQLRNNPKFWLNGGLVFLNIEGLTWKLALEEPDFREKLGINYN